MSKTRPVSQIPVKKADKVKTIGKTNDPAFTIVNVSQPRTLEPVGILALDFDDTIYDSKTKKIINLKEIAEIIQDAYDKHFLIVIVTGRPPLQECIDLIKQVINIIGEGKISAINFTNGKHKYLPLESLYQRFFYKDPKGRRKIALLDNDPGYLAALQKTGMEMVVADDKGVYLQILPIWLNEIYRKHKVPNPNPPKNEVEPSLKLLIEQRNYDDAGWFIDNLGRNLTNEEIEIVKDIQDEEARGPLLMRVIVAEYLHYEKDRESKYLFFTKFSHKDKWNAAKDIQRCLQNKTRDINGLADRHKVIEASKKLTKIMVAAKTFRN